MGPETLRRQMVEGHQQHESGDVEEPQHQPPQGRGQGDQDTKHAEGQRPQQHGGQEPKSQSGEPPRGGRE